MPWRPGAIELLTALGQAGVPNALVTMSWRSLADSVVVARCRPGTFAAVITGDEVEHGKPHPEPYLAAARALGVEVATASPSRTRRPACAPPWPPGVPTLAVPHVVPVPVTVGAVQVPSLQGPDPGRPRAGSSTVRRQSSAGAT